VYGWSARRGAVPVRIGEAAPEFRAVTVDTPIAERRLADYAGNVVIVNVWATWCAPCIAEMPELVEMNRMYRKRPFELITITMDDMDRKDAGLGVLKAHHVSSKNFIYSGEDKDKLVDSLDKQWEGPPPYTMLVAPGGKIIYRKLGPFDAIELKKKIVEHTGRTYASK